MDRKQIIKGAVWSTYIVGTVVSCGKLAPAAPLIDGIADKSAELLDSIIANWISEDLRAEELDPGALDHNGHLELLVAIAIEGVIACLPRHDTAAAAHAEVCKKLAAALRKSWPALHAHDRAKNDTAFERLLTPADTENLHSLVLAAAGGSSTLLIPESVWLAVVTASAGKEIVLPSGLATTSAAALHQLFPRFLYEAAKATAKHRPETWAALILHIQAEQTEFLHIIDERTRRMEAAQIDHMVISREDRDISREALALIKQLLAVGSAVRRVPHQLPPAAHTFFGRATQLAELKKRLLEKQNLSVVGPAGMGKTALAAKALTDLFGDPANAEAACLFPDGFVFLDLYALKTDLDACWTRLANSLIAPDFSPDSPAEVRARAACADRRFLLVIEGAEESDGNDGRPGIQDLLRVLHPEANRRLILTRSVDQGGTSPVIVRHQLDPEDAAALLDSLTTGKPLAEGPKQSLLTLLEGHPLAITWAGGLLSHDGEHPADLVRDWENQQLPSLRDPEPEKATHTLEWLFRRSANRLDAPARRLLEAAGLLSRAPFPRDLMEGCPQVPDARAALRALGSASLLRPAAQNGHWEFTHVLGYQYARCESGSPEDLRQHLAAALHRAFTAALARSAGEPGLARAALLLPHAASLLRTDQPQPCLWRPLANYLLYEGAVRLSELGRLETLAAAIHCTTAWLSALPEEMRGQSQWLRESAACQSKLGNLAVARGDLDEAARHHTAAIAISETLAASDPENTEWQRDLSVSHNKLGDLAVARGDLNEAARHFAAALGIREILAQAEPGNALWQRDLAVSHSKLGNLVVARGDLDEAARHFTAALAITETLAQADPGNAEWQRDLSVSHNKLGDLAVAREDLDEAARHFAAGLAIAETLAASDPGNTEWQRDLSISHNKLGDLAVARGELAKAARHFTADLGIAETLAQADPGNAGWQRDLSVSHNKLGELAVARGDLDEAARHFAAALRIRETLAQADTGNAQWQRDLFVSHGKLARLAEKRGEEDEARQHYQQAHDLLDSLDRRGLHLSPQDRNILLQLKNLFGISS